ncbi:SGNH/GDSL hydrolase family protein [Flavobacterium weaverense]|uniref:Lysophospholipase L1-like esterase n=1 Tax=Flavobacterium weaverense TaxID=271156 RepID=A0A3L9ZYH7_9FLAO|nr:SGNH/GDSL hydrolase family protein [Flavobacterium weaverense]RMA76209.1 lysophospholipase L1-like esterase [Flavobacterium weaverense]
MADNFQSQDWPNLKKYREKNSILPLLKQEDERVIFFGDSITEFWSTVDPNFFADKKYVNRGISGQTTPQMLIRFRADVIALKPTVVVILAGINDIAGNTGFSTIAMITDNIFSMIDIAKANKIKVILCSVLPAFDFHWRPNQEPIEKIKTLNEILKDYAFANKIEFIDYYSSMVDDCQGLKKELSDDGVHPNKSGYQVMQPLAEKAIMLALSRK